MVLPKFHASPPRSRGFALLAVLWLVSLLAIIGASLAGTARVELQFGRNAVEKAKAEAIADAGIYRAVLALFEAEPAARPRTDGTIFSFALAGGEARVRVQDETGKIDINFAPDELLDGLFVSLGMAPEQAAALVDALVEFRDGPGGQGTPGGPRPTVDELAPKYAQFEAIDELQQVPGMTPELYRRVTPFVTVHSWEPGIDPLLAAPEVLLALPGITVAEVEDVLATRAQLSELLSATDDELTVMDEIYLRLAAYEEFLVPSSQTIFTVTAEGRSEGGGVHVREAVVALEFGEPPYRFYSWRQGQPLAGAQ